MFKKRLMRLVDEIDNNFTLSLEIKEAMSSVNREIFLPKGFESQAYCIDSLPIGSKQWISSPLTVAKMTQYLKLEGVDSVLELGCGSGYQACILSKFVRRVFTIERISSLLKEAILRFKEENIHNIHTKLADGKEGWEKYAPFDRILLSASIEQIPKKLIEQLSEDGGILLAPMKKGDKEIITRFKKNSCHLSKEELEECKFVPVLDGIIK